MKSLLIGLLQYGIGVVIGLLIGYVKWHQPKAPRLSDPSRERYDRGE